MKIQFVSDLHLEFPENRLYLAKNPLPVTGDVLLVAGDTAYLDKPDSGKDSFRQYGFWDWASDNFEQVVVCLGNHDFYGRYDLATMPDGYRLDIRHNVAAYYNNVVHIEKVDILVTTLWSHIEPYNAYLTEHGVSDFYQIQYNGYRLSADAFNSEHDRCMKFLIQSVNKCSAERIIVLSHHVPTQLCTAEEFRGSNINGAFTVELGDFIVDSGIDFWIYGHSHRNIDAQIGMTKILSNQLGYIFQGEHLQNGFNPGRYIEI